MKSPFFNDVSLKSQWNLSTHCGDGLFFSNEHSSYALTFMVTISPSPLVFFPRIPINYLMLGCLNLFSNFKFKVSSICGLSFNNLLFILCLWKHPFPSQIFPLPFN